jgi:MFS family permease
VFCAAILLFSVGSALCGAAQSLAGLVVYRLMQGLGGAMMTPVGRLILLRTIPAARMVSAMVWFTVPGAIGRLMGPFFGGAVVTVTSWRWIFLVNVPFGLLGIVMAWWFVPKDLPGANAPRIPFDIKGYALLVAAFAGVLGGLQTFGKDIVPWEASVALASVGLLSAWAYVRYSLGRTEPLIDVGIFRFATYRAAVIGGMPLRIAIGASPFLLPLMLQLGFGLSPLQSGLLTMATAIGSLSTRTVVARAIRAVGFRTLLIGSALLTSGFYMAYGLFTPQTPHLLIFCVLMLGGLCNSMAMVSLNTLGYTEIPKPRMSHATTTSSMAQQLSLTLGVVMGASLVSLMSLLHGGDPAHLQARDFSPAFLAVGTLTLISVAAFRRLRPDEGDELRGK